MPWQDEIEFGNPTSESLEKLMKKNPFHQKPIRIRKYLLGDNGWERSIIIRIGRWEFTFTLEKGDR